MRWTPFERMEVFRQGGRDVEIPAGVVVLKNNAFQVVAATMGEVFPFGLVVWLSIKRLDRRPIHDWRELQRVKNAVLGPEVEAVEIYPAESRLMDTSNQYHLWGFVGGYPLPFGYADRRVSGDDGRCGSKQRPFPLDARPADLARTDDLERMPVERLVRPPQFGRELWLACWMVARDEATDDYLDALAQQACDCCGSDTCFERGQCHGIDPREETR